MRASVQPIFKSPLLKIFDFHCQEEPHSKSEVEPSRHHEITFTRTGDFTIYHGKQCSLVHNQVLMLTNPGTELIFSHRARVRDTCTTLRISRSLLAEVAGSEPDFMRSTIPSTPALDYLHAQIYASATNRLSGSLLKTDLLLLQLLQEVYGAEAPGRIAASPLPVLRGIDQHLETIERAKDFMLKQFDGEMSLHDIARAAYVSDYHFSRIFRAFTRRSPYAYLIQIRLNHATMLLRNTSRSVTEICFDSGFNHFPHFVSTFTRQFGVSPRKFRLTTKR
jgi:AraC-like DNA-binding protein